MHRWIFTYPVFAATLLLIVHSWLYRGRRNTLIFWGLGYLVAFGRELIYQNLFPAYRFTGADFKLFNVPLTIPAGWLFETYISLYVAQFILGADLSTLSGGEERMTAKRYGERVLPVVTLACVVTGTIACAIENIAVKMHWWQNRAGGDGISPAWIAGHMFTVFWISTLLLYLTHPALRLRRNLVYVVLALAFMCVVELIEIIVRADSAWVTALAASVGIAYLASLFMWRRLLAFFVVFLLAQSGDMVARAIAPYVPFSMADESLIWQVFVVLLVMVYGAFIMAMQRSPNRVEPVDLL